MEEAKYEQTRQKSVGPAKSVRELRVPDVWAFPSSQPGVSMMSCEHNSEEPEKRIDEPERQCEDPEKRINELNSRCEELERVQEALRKSEERYRSFVQDFQGIAYRGTLDFVPIFFHGAVKAITGYTEEEFTVGKPTWKEVIHPEDLGVIHESIELIRLTPNYVTQREYRIVRKDGRIRWVHENIQNVCDRSGTPIWVEGAIYDITGQKQTEVALRESEARYRAIVEDQDELICRMRPDATLTFVNGAYCRFFGGRPEELTGQSLMRFIPEEDHKKLKKLLASLNPDKPVYTHECRVIAGNGEARWIRSTNRAIFDERGNIVEFQCVGHDVTELREIQETLLRTQKLESLGVLAGGIAHDFNNLLTGIMGNLSLAKTHPHLQAGVRRLLEEAEKAAKQAERLTQQLLTFSGGGAPLKKAVSIANLLKDIVSFATSGSNVRCDFQLAENLHRVEIDEGQIHQAVYNLVLNALQSMPAGGTIEVLAENVVLENGAFPALMGGDYVKISITDQGIGVAPENISKIFDPYFTTKETGKGLGLAVTYFIIEKHKGHITVQSTLEVGTTFHIYLPAVRGEVVEKSNTAAHEIPKGRGKILLMDDEEIIRHIATEMLAHLGYQAATARDGAEAIRVFKEAKEAGQPFNAVILDLTVPGGMGGREAAGKILEMDPQAKVIVSSGYSHDPIMANYSEYGFRGVIAKPYTLQEFGQGLRQILA